MVCSCKLGKNYCSTYKCNNYGRFQIKQIRLQDEQIEQLSVPYYIILLSFIIFIYTFIMIFIVLSFNNIFL